MRGTGKQLSGNVFECVVVCHHISAALPSVLACTFLMLCYGTRAAWMKKHGFDESHRDTWISIIWSPLCPEFLHILYSYVQFLSIRAINYCTYDKNGRYSKSQYKMQAVLNPRMVAHFVQCGCHLKCHSQNSLKNLAVLCQFWDTVFLSEQLSWKKVKQWNIVR